VPGGVPGAKGTFLFDQVRFRFSYENRIAIDPDRFLIGIVIAIAISKSGSDLQVEIADRF
jgi:hypothetical protein